MPQPGVHVLVALDALHAWRGAVHTAPFDVNSAKSVNAFLHGALGPDMGFFPGGDAVWSARIHTQATGAFARALLAAAITDVQRAYAFGWLTHVLADVAIHPLVNAAADRSGGATCVATHVRIELGFDAAIAGPDDRVTGVQLTDAFSAADMGFIADALHTVYGGRRTDTRMLVAMHGRVSLFLPFALLYIRWLAAGAAPGLMRRGHAALRTLQRWPPRQTVLRAFLEPAPPCDWLMREGTAQVAALQAPISFHAATALRELPDLDLDSGLQCVRPAA